MPPKSKSDWPRCSGCNHAIKTSFNANLHPLLKVLICKACYVSYGTGDFSTFDDGVDENGDDNYCRLCVDGGDLFFCGNNDEMTTKCHYGFCRDCIERVCPKDEVLSVEPDNLNWKWVCLACDSSKLKDARKAAQTAIIRLSMKDLRRGPDLEGPSGSATKKRKTDLEDAIALLEKSKSSKPDGGQKKDSDASSHDKAKPLEADSIPRKCSNEGSHQGPAKTLKMDASGQKKDIEAPEKTKLSEIDSGSARKPERASMSSIEKFKATKSDISQREPEAISVPPLEKPKPAKTSLRNLISPKTSMPTVKPFVSTSQVKSHLSAFVPPTKQQSATVSQTKAPVSQTKLPQSKPSSVPVSSGKPATTKTAPIVTTVPQSKTAADNQKQPIQTQAPTILKSRPTSKQLKVNSEPIVPKIVLSDMELKKRLEHFGHIKNHCIKEINSKFSTILEMFDSLELENKSLLKCEIEDIKRPIHEINNMIANLEGLVQTQI